MLNFPTLKRKLFILIISVLPLLNYGEGARAQSIDNRKFELGGQLTLLNAAAGQVESSAPLVSGISIDRSRVVEPGLGGRIGYRVNDDLTLEAEVNVFPRDRVFEDGRKVQGLFGAKIGRRFDRFGVFGKGRSGFFYASRADFQPRPGGNCDAVSPLLTCFDSSGKLGRALDLGGVFEFYPTLRTILRVDVGDTVVTFKERNVPALINPLPGAPAIPRREVIVPIPEQSTHNFQISVGFGFRF
jgi:hypothetical protein